VWNAACGFAVYPAAPFKRTRKFVECLGPPQTLPPGGCPSASRNARCGASFAHDAKLDGSDTLQLTYDLRQHGIRVLASTIIGMEHHTPETIGAEIDHAVSHDTDFHQFMLYTPLPGTPLYVQMEKEGRLIDVDLADIHGQHKFNWVHPAISRDESKRLLDWAFERDYETNGPSLYRICRTMLLGVRRYKAHPELRVRKRFERDARTLRMVYSGLLWAMARSLRQTNVAVSQRIEALRHEIRDECGPWSALTSAVVGPLLFWTTRREERQTGAGSEVRTSNDYRAEELGDDIGGPSSLGASRPRDV